MDLNLIDWASLFKNLRGVVLLPEEPDEGKLRWLVRKHRYRRLGLSSRYKPASQITQLQKPPFVILHPPNPTLEELPQLLLSKASPLVTDSVVLSCCYSAPLVVTEEGLFKELASFTVWELRSSQSLSEKDLLFHLRVASYVIIDFFSLAREAFEVLQAYLERREEKARMKLEQLCHRRQEKARRDGEKRFWRIPPDPGGKIICAYLDLLPAICQELREGNKRLAEVFTSPWAGLCLPLTCAFSLEV